MSQISATMIRGWRHSSYIVIIDREPINILCVRGYDMRETGRVRDVISGAYSKHLISQRRDTETGTRRRNGKENMKNNRMTGRI